MKSIALILTLFLALTTPVIAADDEEKAAPPKPAYFELQPSVTANLSSGAKYIRFDVQLMLKKEEYVDLVKPHSPALSNEMLLAVSDQDGTALKTPEGKEAFRQLALEAANKVLKELTGKKPVKDLFFTAFFVR